MKNICEHCEHFRKYPHWSKEKSCTKATYRDGSDGYGPFFVKAECIHDERFKAPASKFSPIGESVISRIDKQIEYLEKERERLSRENDTLKERLTKI